MSLCLQQRKIRRAVTTGKSVFSRQPHSSSWCDVSQAAIFMKQVEHKWQGHCITAWAPHSVGSAKHTPWERRSSALSSPLVLPQPWGWLLTRSKVCPTLPAGESRLCLAGHVQGPLTAISSPSFATWPFSSFSESAPRRAGPAQWVCGAGTRTRVWAHLLAAVPPLLPKEEPRASLSGGSAFPEGPSGSRPFTAPTVLSGKLALLFLWPQRWRGDTPEGTTSWETQVPSLMSHLSPLTPVESLKSSRTSSPCSAILDGETDSRVKQGSVS